MSDRIDSAASIEDPAKVTSHFGGIKLSTTNIGSGLSTHRGHAYPDSQQEAQLTQNSNESPSHSQSTASGYPRPQQAQVTVSLPTL